MDKPKFKLDWSFKNKKNLSQVILKNKNKVGLNNQHCFSIISYDPIKLNHHPLSYCIQWLKINTITIYIYKID